MKVLIDNHRDDEYFYQILLFTGQRKDAGTQSKVFHSINTNRERSVSLS